MPKPFPEEKIVELSQFIYRGEKIQAIKLYRELTGLGLKEAKEELAEPCTISDRWTPILTDPSDEALAQLAAEAKVDYLVTHNLRHLEPASGLGVKVLAPKQFLAIVRALP